MQVQYLTISSALAPSREDVEKTRETISNLVREIDRCLVELND
jgi:predicted P-loop ATPase/GTPase